MWVRLADSPVLARVRELVAPIASDLGLDLYDVEQRGGTLRVTLDTPAGSPAGVTLDDLALASRLVSRELDHHDPVPGRYTLEVTSPGVERALRTPDHFRREVGKVVAIRLADVGHDERRITGTLVAADDIVGHRQGRSPGRTGRADRPVRPDRPRQDRLRVGSDRPSPRQGRSARRRRSHRREQPRHERSDPPARPGEGAVRGFPAARPGRCPGVGVQAPARRRRRGRRRGRPGHDGVQVHSPTTSTRTATGSTSATTPPSATSSAASPPRRSAR